MAYVAAVHLALAEGAGEGRHLLTVRCHGPEDGEQLTAAAELGIVAGRLVEGGREVEAFCVTVAAGVAGGGAGGLLLHGDPAAPGGQAVRGWALADGRLRPMSAHEVFDALTDDVARGLPFPPGAVPLPGFALPAFPAEAAPGGTAPGGTAPGAAGVEEEGGGAPG